MLDLNDLRTFEKVATLQSFSAAARALVLPKSNISRSVARLEASLGVRLLERTTRQVVLTAAGVSLQARCSDLLGQLSEALDQVEGPDAEPKGDLHVSAGVGFGVNVLAEHMPEFLRRYPRVDLHLHLATQPVDLLKTRMDVAIRIGPLTDSSLVCVRLGSMRRYLCASPLYLKRRGLPDSVDAIDRHDTIEMPSVEGRPRSWTFSDGQTTRKVALQPRITVDEALTLYRLVCNGAGLGIVSGYLCGPEFAAGRLIHVLPAWALPSLDVHLVFLSKREMSPTVRAFVDHMKSKSRPGTHWQLDVA